MHTAPHLFNEDARLAALAEYNIGDDAPLIDVQDIIELAARLHGVPVVLLSIVERERQVFKAKVGIDVCETSRDASFCAHALTLPPQDMLIVLDATCDPRFADNPYVTAGQIRFYAGVPLRAPTGHAIGTLCILDAAARPAFAAAEQDQLKLLARMVLDRLEVRRLAAMGAAGQSRFENITATSPDGIICADSHGRITFWNAAAERLFGFSAEEAIGAGIDMIVPPRMRGGHGGGLHRVANGGAPRLVGTTVELDAVHKDGTELPVELSLSMWREDGSANFGAIIRDMRGRRQNEERLFKLAHHDGLTDLPNRAVLMERVEATLDGGKAAALLMIDLDGFKHVNDTLGHTAGDAVLRQVADRLLECAQPGESVVRFAGDEFVILMPDRADPAEMETQSHCVLTALERPFRIGDELIHVSASIGMARFPEDGASAEDLLSAADLAMYQAKAEGRGCCRFFTPGLREAVIHRRAFEGEVRRGIENGEFELFYQPQVRVVDGAVLGVEALLRWRHPSRGLLPPGRFLSSIESGLHTAELGRWILDTACADAARLRRHWPDLMMGVNLFGAQFRTGRLFAEVVECLERHRLPPQALELEITENIILRHDETMLTPLVRLRELGMGIAFDDFGTGFASLSMLKRYPLSRIKIDRSFIRDVLENPTDAAIVRTLIALARSLELEVIAEGVETHQQRQVVTAFGCGVIQGYLYSEPLPMAELVRHLWDTSRGPSVGVRPIQSLAG